MPALSKALRRRKRLKQEQTRSRAADDFSRFGERGQEHHEKGRFAEALDSYRKALAADPKNRQARVVVVNLAQCLMELGRLGEAETVVRQAAADYPDYSQAHATLGAILDRQRRLDEAAVALRRAVELEPFSAFYRTNLARVETRRLDVHEGIRQLETAIQLEPRESEHWRELAQALEQDGKPVAAAIAVARALDLDPHSREAIALRGYQSVRRGDFLAGWPDTESRDGKGVIGGSREWRGGDLAGQILLVQEEGGIGDTWQFARYLPGLLERGAERVYFLCRPQLIPILDRSLPGVWYAPSGPVVTIPHHCYVSAQSLPGIAGTTLETIPPPLRLVPDAERVTFWRAELSRLSAGRRPVGIYWQGSHDYKGDYTRSMDSSVLAPLATLPDVQCFSLQLGAGSPPDGVIDLAPRLTSLDETAAVVAALDLVVGVDSMIGHLAGCLGTPTWLLLPSLADWRWLEGRSDSPWYPTTHRLWRQSRLGDWSGPIEGIRHALRGSH